MSKHVSKSHLSTIPASLAYALLQQVADTGISVASILVKVGSPYSFEDLRIGHPEVLSRVLFAAIYRESIVILEEHACRQGNLLPMRKEEVNMLCYCVITCRTLGEVIQRASAFCDMLAGRAGALALEISGQDAIFHMRTFRRKATTSALLSDITGLVTYHRLFSWLIGETIDISNVRVAYGELISQKIVFELLNHTVHFDSESNSFRFSEKLLSKPVIRDPHELNALLVYFPFDILFDYSGDKKISTIVFNILNTKLLKREAMPTIKELAAQLNISNATFRRRLSDENSSLNIIKDRCRYELAMKLLNNRKLTLEEIASHLGFSQASAFSRAFKTWRKKSSSWRL